MFEEIISIKNIFAAWREFQYGKMKKSDVLVFADRAEQYLLKLYGDLKSGAYRHGQYSRFFVCDPKRREISKASVCDRIFHHAIHRVLAPIFEPKFIFDSYSSRVGKGTLVAILRFEKFAWKLSHNTTRTVWILKCDVKRFFDSVDHEILLKILAESVPCDKTTVLLREVIESFSVKEERKGLPLGNLTSQLFSNVYLDPLDQFVKRGLRVKYYLRYADDIFVLDTDRSRLVQILEEMEKFIERKLKLRFHESKTFLLKWHEGVDILGYVSFPHHRVLRTKTKRRMFRKIAVAKETLPQKKFVSVVASYLGRTKHCAGRGLERKIAALFGVGQNGIMASMEKFGTETKPEQLESRRENILERSQASILLGESYEDASKALESVDAIKNFREQVGKLPFGSFFSVFEDITNINRAPISREEKEEETQTLVLEAGARANRFSPRVADLYLAILSHAGGEPYEPQFEMTKEKISGLRQEGDLAVLASGNFSWEMKLNRIETRLRGYLGGARALDKREGREMDDDEAKWREEKLKEFPASPPERRNESRPGVDPMERLKSGERAPAIWSISPAVSGVFREQSLSRWDEAGKVWTEDEYQYSDADFVPLCEKEDRRKGMTNITMKAESLPGKWTALPVPYTHNIHKIEADGRNVKILKDQNGDFVFMIEGSGEGTVEVTAILSPSQREFVSDNPNAITAPDFQSTVFSEETNGKIAEIGNSKRGNVTQGNRLAGHVHKRIKYLAPKDYAESDYYNNLYRNHPGGFAGGVDEAQKADCDVGNTYFAALCARLDIPVRHVIGHSVSGDSIHSATGHAWSEVWDETANEWVKIDATPPGDPNLEEKDKNSGEQLVSLGDNQGPIAVRPSDEELEKLRKRLEERKEELSYTREERELAEAGDIEPKEARKIVKEINEAENTRLPNGELLVDVLSDLFGAIIKSRKTRNTSYTGSVNQNEGGEEIENIVSHYIQANSGNADPISRSVSTEEAKIEKIIGGFDYYQIGDKTASMGTVAEGETLLQMQRRAEYVILSSLHRFARNLKQAGIKEERSLAVRSQAISFKGDNEVDQDKPLSADFSAQDKVRLWKSLSQTTAGVGEIAALSHVFTQITEERELLKKEGKEDNRLRLIIACSDGGGGDAEQVHLLAEKFHELNAMLVGVGLTETAATVPIIYDTPHSRGDIAQDINDLPLIVGKHLVLEAVKLFPEHAKANAVKLTEDIINKFKKA